MAWSEIGTIKGDKGDPGPSTPSAQSGNTIVKGSDNLLYSASEVDANAISGKSTTKAPTGSAVDAALGLKADTTYVDGKVVAFAGGISLVGTYDATTGANKVASVTTGVTGITAGQALPAASASNKGWYLIVTAGGTGSGNAPAVNLIPGDWLVSTSTAWTRMDMSAHEKEIYYQAAQPTTGTGTLVGQLWIDSDDRRARVKTATNTFGQIVAEADTSLSSFTNAVDARPDVAVATTAPAVGGTEKLWANPSTNALSYKSAGAWSTATLRGAGWHTGSGAPPASVAGSQVGDLWLDVTSGKVWKLA